MIPHPAARLGLLLGLLLLVGPPGRAQDGHVRDYRDGVAALEAGDWAEAARLLRSAIAADPEERRRLRFHMVINGRPYLPHFHLGVALSRGDRCEPALEALAESERQGVVVDRKEMATLERVREACRSRLRRIAAAEEQVRSTEAAVQQLAERVADLSRTPELRPDWRQGSPSPAERQAAAAAEIGRAAALLGAQGEDRIRELDEASQHLDRARAELVDLLGEATRARSARRAQIRGEEERRVQLRAAVDDRVDDARRLLRRTEYIAPFPPRVLQARQQIRALIEEAADAAEDADPDRWQDLAERLDAANQRLRAEAAPPPQPLIEAADAFARGDYALAVVLLRPRSFDDPRLDAHAKLLLSASLYRLSQLVPDAATALLEEARAAAGEAAEAGLEAPASLFSPSFARFFAAAKPVDPADAPAATTARTQQPSS